MSYKLMFNKYPICWLYFNLCGAKVQLFFEICKKNALLLAFFSLEDAASRYCLEVIGEEERRYSAVV